MSARVIGAISGFAPATVILGWFLGTGGPPMPGLLRARAAAAIGTVWVAVYLIFVRGPGIGLEPNVAFYAGFVGVMTALSGASTLPALDPRFAQALRYAAAAGLVLAGALGAASIGFPLALAGLLALAATGPRRIPRWASMVAATISGIAFVAGVAMTWPRP